MTFSHKKVHFFEIIFQKALDKTRIVWYNIVKEVRRMGKNKKQKEKPTTLDTTYKIASIVTNTVLAIVALYEMFKQ